MVMIVAIKIVVMILMTVFVKAVIMVMMYANIYLWNVFCSENINHRTPFIAP
jgi:hypothetical protein